MDEQGSQPQYKPGDVANGHFLTHDLQWVPLVPGDIVHGRQLHPTKGWVSAPKSERDGLRVGGEWLRMPSSMEAALAHSAEMAAEAEKLGREVASERFWTTKIRIWENGYVKVGWGAVEELLYIEYSDNFTKKTGVGRSAAAVLTGGVSLFAPNERGDAFLTVSTPSGSKVLKVGSSDANDSVGRAGRALEATGRAVIARREASAQNPAPAFGTATPNAPASTASRLQELEQLLAAGQLSRTEYDEIRARILSQF